MVSTSFTSRRVALKPLLKTGRRAFTLIELLVVIGIILILAGILLVAVRRLGTTSKEHATHITLSNLQAMLNEYGSATGFKTEPAGWIWNNCSFNAPVTLATAPPVTTSFWTALQYDQSKIPPVILAIAGPQNVNADSESPTYHMRTASPEVLNTLVAMNLICRIPANRTAISNLPPQTLFVPAFVAGTVATAGSDGFFGTSDDSSAPIIYPPGCHIQNAGKYFVCLNPDSGPPTAGANWRDESAAPQTAPIILDAWGNPIIFVPGGGLNVLLLNGGTTYDSSNPNLKLQTVIAPDKRPFWASAGPDGDFSKGDDNVYSFEQ